MMTHLPDTERNYAGVVIQLTNGRELRHLVDEFFAFTDALWYIDPSWGEWHSHHPEHCFRGHWSAELFLPDDDGIRSIEFVATDVRRRSDRQREKLHRIAQQHYERLLAENTSNG